MKQKYNINILNDDILIKIIEYIFIIFKIEFNINKNNFRINFKNLNNLKLINKQFYQIISQENHINRLIIDNFFKNNIFLNSLFDNSINYYKLPILKFKNDFISNNWYISNINLEDFEDPNNKINNKYDYNGNIKIGIDDIGRPFIVFKYKLLRTNGEEYEVIDCMYQFASFYERKWSLGSNYNSYFNKMLGFISDYACYNKFAPEIRKLIFNKKLNFDNNIFVKEIKI